MTVFPKTKGATYVNLKNVLDQLWFQKMINEAQAKPHFMEWILQVCSYMTPVEVEENN